MNLFQRINEVRKEVDYIQKDKAVSTGGGSYKAVTHDQVTAFTRGAMVKHGVISFPYLVTSSMNEPHQIEGEKTNKQWRYEAVYDIAFCNVDNMDEKIVIRVEAHAMDNADKAPGKALSYAKKYAVLKLLEIETGESDEGRIPDEFDPQPYIETMESAKSVDELNAAFKALQSAGGNEIDKNTMKAILGKKNELAKSLAAKETLSDERFAKAVAAIKAGKATKESVLSYALTDEQRAQVEGM